jgi:outer membrane lipoprotein SlyB
MLHYIISYHIISYHIMLHHIISYHIISHHVIYVSVTISVSLYCDVTHIHCQFYPLLSHCLHNCTRQSYRQRTLLCDHTDNGHYCAIIQTTDTTARSYRQRTLLCYHTDNGHYCAIIQTTDTTVRSYRQRTLLRDHTDNGHYCAIIQTTDTTVRSYRQRTLLCNAFIIADTAKSRLLISLHDIDDGKRPLSIVFAAYFPERKYDSSI